MNTPRRSKINSVTVPFKKLPPAMQSRILSAKSRSAELADILNEFAILNDFAERTVALEKDLAETRKALDAAMLLVAHYRGAR